MLAQSLTITLHLSIEELKQRDRQAQTLQKAIALSNCNTEGRYIRDPIRYQNLQNFVSDLLHSD